MIQHKETILNGMPIHYVEAGTEGPDLVIIHGITGSHATYLPLVPALAQHAHVYALDLRGHNLSGRAPGAYQASDYARDVAAFLREVVGRPAVVAGHSLGGIVTVWLAAQAHEWVRSIFLEDPPLYITQPPRLQESLFYGYFLVLHAQLLQHHANSGTLDDMTRIVGQSPMGDERTMLDVVGPERVRLRAIELHRMDPAVLAPALEGVILGDRDPDDVLAQVRCPIHLLAADASFGGAMDARDVQRFVAAAPGCTHMTFEGVGHGIHDERPDAYVQALQRFMGSTGATEL